MKIIPETRIRRNPDAAWRLLDDKLIAVTAHDTAIHRFNKTGTLLWNKLGSGNKTVLALAQALSNEYNLPEKKAVQHATAFIKKAAARKILILDD